MSELKTQKNDASVEQFLAGVDDEQKREDCRTLVEIMKKITKEEPAMWGESIVGFGSYHYHYASGREGDWFLTGFSPRKKELTLYLMCGFDGHEELMSKLGKFKTGKSCLYVNRLDEIHLPTLKTLVQQSVRHTKKMDKAT